MIMCIQCAMEAVVAGKMYQGEPDATIEGHIKRMHPDLHATKARRAEMERILSERLALGQGLMHDLDSQ